MALALCRRRLLAAARISSTNARYFSDDFSSLFDQNVFKTKNQSENKLGQSGKASSPSFPDGQKRKPDNLDLLDLQFTKPEKKSVREVVEQPKVEPVEEIQLLPPFRSDEELIDHVCDVLKNTEWRDLYKKLALLGDQVKAHHALEIIKRARDSSLVFSFYMWVRARRHIKLDQSVLNLLFEILSSTDKAEEMEWLIVQMHKRKMELTDSMFVTVMLAYSRLNRVDDAAKLFLKMDELGCKPPKTSSFNCILRLLLNAEKNLQFDVMHSRMKMVRKMNTITYEILMAKTCRFGGSEAAYKLFQEMKTGRHEISVAAYASLVECVSKEGREDIAFEVLEQMESPSEEVYNPLVRNLVNAGKLGTALTQYKKMLELGLKPYSSTCVPILSELIVTEKAAQACTLFKEMAKLGYLSPEDVVTISDRAYKTCKVEMVWSFLKELPSMGLNFDPGTIHLVITGLINQDRVDLARKLFRSFLDSGKKLYVSTYNLFIRKLATPEGSKQMLELMKQAGCEPDVDTYNGIMDSYIRGNLLSEAYNLFVEMTDKEYEANLVTYKLLIQILSRNANTTTGTVIEALTRLKEKGKFEGAGKYLDKLSEERLLPSLDERATDGKVLVRILQSDGRRLDDVYM